MIFQVGRFLMISISHERSEYTPAPMGIQQQTWWSKWEYHGDIINEDIDGIRMEYVVFRHVKKDPRHQTWGKPRWSFRAGKIIAFYGFPWDFTPSSVDPPMTITGIGNAHEKCNELVFTFAQWPGF